MIQFQLLYHLGMNPNKLKKQESLRKQRYIQKKKAKNQVLAQNAHARRNEWLNKVQSEQSFHTQYFKGAQQFDNKDKIPRFRPGAHVSESLEHQQKFFGKRNVFAYTQTTSKERAEIISKEFRETHLSKDAYRDYDPSRAPLKWLKNRDKFQEHSINLKYNDKNEMDRVMHVKANHHKKASFEPSNTQTLFGPITKSNDKTLWASKKDFNSTIGKSDQGWAKIPFVEKDEYEPYHAKFVSISEFSRKRDKSRETGSTEWDGYSHSDSIWKNRTMTSNSLRTLSSIHGYIQTVNGRVENFNRTNATDNLQSFNVSMQKIGSHKRINPSLGGQTGIETQSTHSLSTLNSAPIPTKFTIDKGDLSKIQEFLSMKKELTQQSSLYYLPDRQLEQTMNRKLKGPQNITDQYLMNQAELCKQKTYFKSAEILMKQEPNAKKSLHKSQTLGNFIHKHQGGTHLELPYLEITNTIDISKLLLNEKLNQHSPLISARKSPTSSRLEGRNEGQSDINLVQVEQSLKLQPFLVDGQEKASTIPVSQLSLKKHTSIQEESDETDDEMSRKKKSQPLQLPLEKTNTISIQERFLAKQKRLKTQKTSSSRDFTKSTTATSSDFIMIKSPSQGNSKNDEKKMQLQQVMDNYFARKQQDQSPFSKGNTSPNQIQKLNTQKL